MKQCTDCGKSMKTCAEIARIARGYTNCITCAEKDTDLPVGYRDDEGEVHFTTKTALNKLRESERFLKGKGGTYREG